MTDRENSMMKVFGVTTATESDPEGVIVVRGRSPATDKLLQCLTLDQLKLLKVLECCETKRSAKKREGDVSS